MTGKDDVNDWTVNDVSEWLESIGLGHKNDVVEQQKINGGTLVGATVEDLKAFGFSALQAKKMQKEVAAIIQQPAAAAASKETADAETLLLRKELDELKSIVLDLKKKNALHQKLPQLLLVRAVALHPPRPSKIPAQAPLHIALA